MKKSKLFIKNGLSAIILSTIYFINIILICIGLFILENKIFLLVSVLLMIGTLISQIVLYYKGINGFFRISGIGIETRFHFKKITYNWGNIMAVFNDTGKRLGNWLGMTYLYKILIKTNKNDLIFYLSPDVLKKFLDYIEDEKTKKVFEKVIFPIEEGL